MSASNSLSPGSIQTLSRFGFRSPGFLLEPFFLGVSDSPGIDGNRWAIDECPGTPPPRKSFMISCPISTSRRAWSTRSLEFRLFIKALSVSLVSHAAREHITALSRTFLRSPTHPTLFSMRIVRNGVRVSSFSVKGRNDSKVQRIPKKSCWSFASEGS